MEDSEFFATLIQEQYPAAGATVQLLAGSAPEARAVLRVDLPDGEVRLVQARPQDARLPEWLYACAEPDTPSWMCSRAATLAYLAAAGYPAPRVIRTRAGAAVAETQGWCLLATSFVQGTITLPTVGQVRGLGAALGRLHAVPSPSSDHPIGRSWWDLDGAVPLALGQLARIANQVPPRWVDLHAACCATFAAIGARTDLPGAVIHADPWAANAVETRDGAVLLIDWECAGWGLAVLDLGRLLLECHLDQDQPASGHIQPDVERIAAVVTGYRAYRSPTAAELAVLLEAMRFSVAFDAARHFAEALEEGWTAAVERRLARRANRYAVSATIADLAYSYLLPSSQQLGLAGSQA